MRGAIDFTVLRLPDRRSSFHSALLHADEKLIILADKVRPSTTLRIGDDVVIAEDYLMIWFLYKGEPWDVCRFYRPDGCWTGYYVDVLEPVRWQHDDPYTLDAIVDLFLDLWITPGGTVSVLDQDEFDQAIRDRILSSSRQSHARRVLTDLQTSKQAGSFPPREVREFTL